MALISLVEGAVIGAVVVVLVPKAFAWVKKQITSGEADAKVVAAAAAAAVANTVASKL